jgi:hypothetical protein
VGLTLNSWELGNGSLLSTEVTNQSETTLSLDLNSIWKNETIESGSLTSQVFDARGDGSLLIITEDDGTTTRIVANVSDGRFNRTMIDGNISERVNLEATGALDINGSDEEGTLTIDGDISVLFLETWDENGVRRLDHTQFEALASMILEDDETRFDIDLDGLTTIERWEDGVRTEHKEELVGSGTFGFGESNENSSVQVNGTILDFHTLIEDGTTLTDDLHIDGVITGDAQGSFGIVRTIEATGDQANATGIVFLVNVIHQETWFNLTGVGGGFFGGDGIGASHNETWDYQVVQSDWDNRTVRIIWEETGADASSGDEKPARSPIQQNATQPEAQEILGDITIVRETGLMPIPMMAHDVIHLNGENGLELTVEAYATGNDPRDGFNLSVVHWTGTYGESGGVANGSIVDEGPLMGLVSSVVRSLELPFGDGNDTALFSESQVVERILSPSIITAENNSAPVLVSMDFLEGLAIGEGGSTGTLVAHITDAEFNIESVTVDLTPLGGGLVTMNDRGLDGDAAIGDDRYTTRHIVKGLEVGNVTLNVTAEDWFGSVMDGQSTVQIVNQGPRLTSVVMLPDRGPRGTTLIINAQAYDGHGVESVQIDMRMKGGNLVDLVETSGVWAGNFSIPETIAPGEHELQFILTDALGRKSVVDAWHGQTANTTFTSLYGEHAIPDGVMNPVTLLVYNTPPSIVAPDNLALTKGGSTSTALLEVEIYDTDGIAVARANLGVFTPLGTQATWVSMNDEGINGDRVPGDGIYTVEMSVRQSIPIGTHEVIVQASDSYGEATGYTSINVKLSEEGASVISTDGNFLSDGILIGILVMFGIGVAVMIVISIRNGPKRGDGEDMFGHQ